MHVKIIGDTAKTFTSGFSDWKHAKECIVEHEGSETHRKAMLTYLLESAEKGQVDSELKKQFETECEYWYEVLRRVVAVVKFLAELPFRGHSAVFGDPSNGNYLGILELLSQFDPFLKAHIEKYGNAGKGQPSYLSHGICEEFIQLMREKVLCHILNEIEIAKYFSISVDSTPDVAHTDQLTLILRYLSREGCIEERFLKFLPITSHTGDSLCTSVLTALKEMEINFDNCRGQCYDNANNMSGCYKGLQSRLKEINPLVEWVPCAAHTLNLVGVNSVNCCLETEDFFSFVQTLFNFCSRSPSQWQTITAGLQPDENSRIETLKTLSDTRWSVHAEATKALCLNYANIQESLRKIADDANQQLTPRDEASLLCKKMDKLEIAFLCNMWNTILQRFYKTSTTLQTVDLDLSVAVNLIRSLKDFVAELRNQFDTFEAKQMSPTVSAVYKSDSQRQRKRKKRSDESAEPDQHLSGRDLFSSSVFILVIDRLVAEHFHSVNSM